MNDNNYIFGEIHEQYKFIQGKIKRAEIDLKAGRISLKKWREIFNKCASLTINKSNLITIRSKL